MKIVIADASCLIALDNISETELLRKLYTQIFVTPEVALEVGRSLPAWVDQRSSSNQNLVDQLSDSLEIGEASSIALALEMKDCLLIIDEKKGRRTAKQLGIEITGTFGVVMKSLDDGLIRTPESIVSRLESAGFRISDFLKEQMRSKIH